MDINKLHVDKEIPTETRVSILELAKSILTASGDASLILAAMQASQAVQAAYYRGKIEGMAHASATWKSAIDKAVQS